jgi:signal peptide peptidase SppA
MIEEHWFRSAVEAVKNGTMQPKAKRADDFEDEEEERIPKPRRPYNVHNGIALIVIAGPLMKKASKFGGTSSVETRSAIRKAVNDEEDKSILLHIDSPGGTVAGTADLAADVKAANVLKPVYAYIEDLGASAAYWVASQARRITANATAEVGSIGTLLVLADTSGMYESKGIKVHVISTGKYKGAGADGAPVTDDHIKMFQEEVDDLNEHFLNGVAKGRKGKMTMAQVREVADGRCHIASKAKDLGLIDEVGSLDVVMSFIRKTDVLEEENEPIAEANLGVSTQPAMEKPEQNKTPNVISSQVQPKPKVPIPIIPWTKVSCDEETEDDRVRRTRHNRQWASNQH